MCALAVAAPCPIHSQHPAHFFFFNDTATAEIYTLSLHDALPIFREDRGHFERVVDIVLARQPALAPVSHRGAVVRLPDQLAVLWLEMVRDAYHPAAVGSEEHPGGLRSRPHPRSAPPPGIQREPLA